MVKESWFLVGSSITILFQIGRVHNCINESLDMAESGISSMTGLGGA